MENLDSVINAVGVTTVTKEIADANSDDDRGNTEKNNKAAESVGENKHKTDIKGAEAVEKIDSDLKENCALNGHNSSASDSTSTSKHLETKTNNPKVTAISVDTLEAGDKETEAKSDKNAESNATEVIASTHSSKISENIAHAENISNTTVTADYGDSKKTVIDTVGNVKTKVTPLPEYDTSVKLRPRETKKVGICIQFFTVFKEI